MSLLTVIQKFADRTGGISRPTSIFSNSDPQVRQLLGLSQEILEDLIDRRDWQELRGEGSFTSVSGSDQGLLTSMASTLYTIVNGTIFNRTTGTKILGPVSPEEWQLRKAGGPFASPYGSYRIMGGHLYVLPEMAAGEQCYFEYKSSRMVVSGDGSTLRDTFEADGDTLRIAFGESLLLLGLRWKWKSEKGLAYGEEFAAYEAKIGSLSLANKTASVIDLSEDCSQPTVQIVLPATPLGS